MGNKTITGFYIGLSDGTELQPLSEIKEVSITPAEDIEGEMRTFTNDTFTATLTVDKRTMARFRWFMFKGYVKQALRVLRGR